MQGSLVSHLCQVSTVRPQTKGMASNRTMRISQPNNNQELRLLLGRTVCIKEKLTTALMLTALVTMTYLGGKNIGIQRKETRVPV